MYTVTATRQGTPFASLDLPAANALAAELLIWLKTRMSEGVTAETVANWATWRYADKETVALVIGAAHYIERAGKVE